MNNPFTDHPSTVGETYTEHLKFALITGLKMLLASLAVIVHAFLPFVFKTTGRECIECIHKKLSTRT